MVLYGEVITEAQKNDDNLARINDRYKLQVLANQIIDNLDLDNQKTIIFTEVCKSPFLKKLDELLSGFYCNIAYRKIIKKEKLGALLQYNLYQLQEQVDESVAKHQNGNCNQCLEYMMSASYDSISEASSDNSSCPDTFSEYYSYSDSESYGLATIDIDACYKKSRRKSI